MTPDAYWYISIAYLSIGFLTGASLLVKKYKDSFKKLDPEIIEYMLHILHIPPYIIASYWYYDSYVQYQHVKYDQSVGHD